MWLSDQYEVALQWRGDDPDPQPHYELAFLVLLLGGLRQTGQAVSDELSLGCRNSSLLPKGSEA